jgi:site-specific DNA-methyltransferase (adenine-specific)
VLQADKFHLTGKPTAVMRELVKIVRPGGVVLDPFMGSGTTGVACIEAGLDFIGCEAEEAIFAIADHRIRGATQ